MSGAIWPWAFNANRQRRTLTNTRRIGNPQHIALQPAAKADRRGKLRSNRRAGNRTFDRRPANARSFRSFQTFTFQLSSMPPGGAPNGVPVVKCIPLFRTWAEILLLHSVPRGWSPADEQHANASIDD